MSKFLFSFLLLLSFFFLLPSFSLAQTQNWSGRCVATFGTDQVATIQGFECLFYNVLQVIVIFAGLAFLFMFISGGFQYLTSSSDQKAVATASSTLTMAVIGLVGVIGSWLILKFIQDFTGITITKLIIPG